MVNAEPGGSSENAAALRPRERIYAARYVLGAACASLLAAVPLFDLPLLYALCAAVLLVVLAASPFRARPLDSARGDGLSSPQTWPDTSMKATVEALAHPGFILDAMGTVRYANREAAALFPATRPGDPFIGTFRRPEFADAVEDAAAGQATSVEFREPGAPNSYLTQLSPLRAPGGAVSFVLVSFEDVSDRLAIARMRADFVANASHELRTPLASVTGFIETLMGPARSDPAATEKFLRIMLDQAWRMRRLIDDLLSLSRAEMRVHNRPTDRADLVAVIGHACDAMQPLAGENGVELVVEKPKDGHPKDGRVDVIGDHEELAQVVQNLVENAIRYGGSGGRVDVRLVLPAGKGKRVAVQVEDYGPGIAAEHVPRLTERFYRVDVGASRELKGTGLGLAIVKHILTRHGGELDVASEPGKGSRFTAELPLPPEAVDADGEISEKTNA